MGKQAVLAIVETTIAGEPPLNYIDAGTTFPYGGKLKIFVDGTESAIGSALINAISNISPTNTRITEINILAQTPMGFAGVNSYTFFANSNLTIWIDWANGNVQWQGRWLQGPEYQLDNGATTQPGCSTYQGSQAISAVGNTTITLTARSFRGSSYTGFGLGPNLTLETGPNREILKLPIFAYGSDANRPATNSYTITTDDGQVVATSSTPPAETSTAEVSGVKISELSAVDTLQDDDLFVLSQDAASDGTYEASLNVTLANLRAGIVIGEIVNLYYDGDYILGPISSGTWMVHLQGQQSSGSGDLDEDVLVSISRKYTVAAGQYLWFKCTDMSTTFSGVSELYNSSSSTPATSDPGWLAYTTTSDPKAESYDAQTRPDNDGITFLFEGVETPYCVGFAIKVA